MWMHKNKMEMETKDENVMDMSTVVDAPSIIGVNTIIDFFNVHALIRIVKSNA